MELRNFSAKESMLFALDDATVCENNSIQTIEGEEIEEGAPEEEIPETEGETEEGGEHRVIEIRWQDEPSYNRQETEEDYKAHWKENCEAMASQEEYHLLSVLLAFEVSG